MLLAAVIFASASCGPDVATPISGPVELVVRFSGHAGQQLDLVASARNLGGLPLKYRGEQCGPHELRSIYLSIKAPGGETMFLHDPLHELHACGSTDQELGPGATAERTVALNGYLYLDRWPEPLRMPMPPGQYTVTFYFIWVLDDHGAQIRFVERPMIIEWPEARIGSNIVLHPPSATGPQR